MDTSQVPERTDDVVEQVAERVRAARSEAVKRRKAAERRLRKARRRADRQMRKARRTLDTAVEEARATALERSEDLADLLGDQGRRAAPRALVGVAAVAAVLGTIWIVRSRGHTD